MFCAYCGVEAQRDESSCHACGEALPELPASHSTVTVSSGPHPSDSEARTIDSSSHGGRLDVTATPTTTTNMVGQAFGTRYHIIRELGRGGMGVVYQAWDDELGVAVALKTILPDTTADPEAARERELRFKRELVLARKVTHKHVVRIHDLGEVNGIKYLTMPFIQGETLGARVRRERHLPVAKALRYAKQIVSGLVAAHEEGVVHRDLKPANIMIDADDEAVILDFGLARSVSGMTMATSAGVVMGTVEYMAPEQASGSQVDQRADVYAFGLILHEMLVGRRRSSDSALNELLLRAREAPPSVRSIDPQIPEAVDEIVARCTRPSPADRYQTAAELAAALDRLDSEGFALVPRSSSRKWLVPVLASAAAIALAVAATVLLLGGRSSPAVAAPHEAVSVLIADFDNRTGESIFDASLEQTLAIAMEGSSFVSVFPQKAAREVSAQVSPSAGGRVNREVGQLICRREGVKVLLAGAIERAGANYHLGLRAFDPSDGRQIAAADGDASDKAQVLQALGSLAQSVRGELGESKSEMAKVAAAETFTAGSLEAMQAYARGQQLTSAGKYREALASLQKAVQYDPGLGRAYSLMGAIYANLKESSRAEANFQLAMKNLTRMSEREKYRTLAIYYLVVADNYDKAIENYEALIKSFPADNVAYGNLAVAYVRAGNIARAREVQGRGLEIYPRNLMWRTNYAAYCVYAGDFATASREAERVLKENPQYEFAYLPLALSKAGQGDVEGARKAYQRLAGVSDTGRSLAVLGLADLDVYAGRFDSAATTLRGGLGADETEGSSGELATKHLVLAEIALARGNRPDAVAEARKAAAGSHLLNVVVPAGEVLFDAGAEAAARDIAKDLDARLQNQTSAYARVLEGYGSVGARRSVEAIDVLKGALKRQDTWLAHFILGRAYFDAGHFEEALGEWEGCYKRRGEVMDMFFADSPTVRYLPPLYYWLGRAREAVGDTPDAIKAYREYVTTRDQAAADPLLADARRRLDR